MKQAILLALIFCGVSAVPAFADHHEGHESESEKLRMADTDKDGEITKAEFQAEGDRMFAKMDKDGNGTLNDAEIAACDMKHKDGYKKGKDENVNRDDRNSIEKRSDTNHEQPDDKDAEAGPNLGGTEHNQTGGEPAGDNNPQN